MARGLAAAWAWPGGYGQDMAGVAHMTPAGSVSHDGARGLVTHAGSGVSSSYQAVAPAALRLPFPVTLVWQGSVVVTSPDSNAGIFGVTYDNSNTAPFASYQIAFGSAANLVLNLNNGTFSQVDSATTLSAGPHWLAATLASGSQKLYRDDPTTALATGSASGSISYGTSPILAFGQASYVSNRDPAMAHEYGLIYGRALTTAELGWLQRRGRDLFARPRSRIGWEAALVAASAAGPSAAVPANTFNVDCFSGGVL